MALVPGLLVLLILIVSSLIGDPSRGSIVVGGLICMLLLAPGSAARFLVWIYFTPVDQPIKTKSTLG